ncbi:hypothetical protein PHLGIDRAFT_18548 [Phlebiopsis gigantea 11061_1 CR5-6]|uniref:Uncharacterized protein n=1 Tax=Phlebiopsis gigantea (strain 11061_1 CR5-6) TaxID=745531 RepID=A0A0C3SDH6_PHLG1|nr:hypothetical protein PHLGIDRAFT_18548 [Phlebiopsis gigantea 11061_1 CR5-6]
MCYELDLPSSTINRIVADPSMLNSVSANATVLDELHISPSAAAHILSGYNSGFRTVFIINATLAATATVVSALMIRHLTRDDEAQLRARAEEEEAREVDKQGTVRTDIEMGTWHDQTDDGVEGKA